MSHSPTAPLQPPFSLLYAYSSQPWEATCIAALFNFFFGGRRKKSSMVLIARPYYWTGTLRTVSMVMVLDVVVSMVARYSRSTVLWLVRSTVVVSSMRGQADKQTPSSPCTHYSPAPPHFMILQHPHLSSIFHYSPLDRKCKRIPTAYGMPNQLTTTCARPAKK